MGVNLELARRVLVMYYDDEKSYDEISKITGLTKRQVWSLVKGETAKPVYASFSAGRTLTTRLYKYSDELLLQAFDLRFKDGLSPEEVCTSLDIDKSFLSGVYFGHFRPELRERWSKESGIEIPTVEEIRQAAGRAKKHTGNQFGGQCAVQDETGKQWVSITACAKELGVSPTGLLKAINKKTSCCGKFIICVSE